MNRQQALGFQENGSQEMTTEERSQLRRYLALQLASHGLPEMVAEQDAEFLSLVSPLLENYRVKSQALHNHRCPIDQRIESFLQSYFTDLSEPLRLPHPTFTLDRHGLARELSLPAYGDKYTSEWLESYRVKNGVLHNPRHDRRTTHGTFHVVEGGLPIPGDKKAVPMQTFVALFRAAVQPPIEHLRLPFHHDVDNAPGTFVSLMLRPMLSPEVLGISPRMTMETRFFVPGNFVSNLDFVESIFGNAGDPSLPENDAGLDVEHWSGHTGAVLLAPHLLGITKKEVGLPHYDDATERQRNDGMCWKTEDEAYNDGSPYKITCRDERGVVVTIITDNYFGYCKKEVKTQLSYAANLFGNVEEEHAGGAIAFPSFNLGEEYKVNSQRYNNRDFRDVINDYGEMMEVNEEEGYGVDRQFPELIYIPGHATASMPRQKILWEWGGVERSIPLLPGQIYMTPSGYKIRMEKHPAAPTWRLVGTIAEGTFCHKPCTVSGGGKSEISKSLVDYMHYGSIFVADIQKDFAQVQAILDRDFSKRWKLDSPMKPSYKDRPSRGILAANRSLGSVIKLLTRSVDYNSEFNEWLESIPNHIYALLFMIKRFYDPAWGDNWQDHFNVDIVNGEPGHELKHHHRKLVGIYLRVGVGDDDSWRTFKVRQDFAAAAKIQTEDDITGSLVVPADRIAYLNPQYQASSVKFAANCEFRLFQRPDDAIHRGLDKQTELDLSQGGNFISNFEPLSRDRVSDMKKYVVDFDAFSEPMQKMLNTVVEDSETEYVVCSANPRQVGGKPSKNPRYLQARPDVVNPRNKYIAEVGTRLYRAIPLGQPVPMPVNASVPGRRNNPPDTERGIRALAVYNPIHYQELPELFMDFISSLTGKSPSTTGAGSEGALTKGPFNAIRTAADLNTALVSAILTETSGFTTAAGWVGPQIRVDHDLSMLLPELWSRIAPEERDPQFLISEGLLEPLKDYEHQGETIEASCLGYRITSRFVRRYFGRIFDNPDKVLDEPLLRPETQDEDAFADGVNHIMECHQRVARRYITDETIKELAPPLQYLIGIMAEGSWEGLTRHDTAFRSLFTKEALLKSEWYQQRLATRQQKDIARWQRHLDYLVANTPVDFDLSDRMNYAKQKLEEVSSKDYLNSLQGMLGAHPF